jgi:hypothetical protein
VAAIAAVPSPTRSRSAIAVVPAGAHGARTPALDPTVAAIAAAPSPTRSRPAIAVVRLAGAGELALERVAAIAVVPAGVHGRGRR